jgi:RNA polymerase sigma-70 factor (ECF subfamily)
VTDRPTSTDHTDHFDVDDVDAGGSSLSLPGDEFVQLFTRNQRRLYLFILGQCPSPADAEEILQETNIVIWKKFHQFEPGTNFTAWACRIARFEVLKFRERHRRDRLQFSDEFVRQVAEASAESSPMLEARRQALAKCLEKLRPQDRELIRKRYATGQSGQSVAEALQRPVNSIYQSLGRIRRVLLECVNRQLSAEVSSS